MTGEHKKDKELCVSVSIDECLVQKAQTLVGHVPLDELLRHALVGLIERESSRRLALLTQEQEGHPVSGPYLYATRRSVESGPGDATEGTERNVDEGALSELVAEVKQVVNEARSELRKSLSEVRAMLEELRRSRRL